MTEFANFGINGFRMGLSVMAATKLVDACLMYYFSRCYAAMVKGVVVEFPFTPSEYLNPNSLHPGSITPGEKIQKKIIRQLCGRHNGQTHPKTS